MPNAPFREYSARLLSRFMRVAVAIMACACVAFFLWSFASQTEQVTQVALTEARSLSRQFQAVGSYVDAAHGLSSSATAEGSMTVYGATLSQGVSESFSQQPGGYVSHVVSADASAGYDTPDDFEARALAAFASTSQAEFYELGSAGSSPVFRYASRLLVESGTCADGVAAAFSVTIPVASYVAAAMQRTVFAAGFFVVVIAIMGCVLRRLLRSQVVGPMERAGVRLEEDAAAKADFLALMSHELRTPLSSIIAFTDLWESSSAERDERERYLVRAIRENSDVLLNMVNNTIDMAKVDAGKYELQMEDVDLLDVMGAVQAMAEPLALKRGVRFELRFDPATPIVRGDWEALRKVLANLVGNALKFTDAGGSVVLAACPEEAVSDVAVQPDPTESGQARPRLALVSVADTGCGISEEDRARIFERFEQGASALGSACANREKGSGLGLSLSLELARMMGADITLASEPGKGSTFTVHVPAAGTGEEGV